MANKWTDKDNVELAELVEKYGRQWTVIQKELSTDRTVEQIRKHYSRYLSVNATRINKLQSNPIENARNHRIHKYLSNGEEYSERIIPLEALQTRESMMEAHGYDPREFELVDSTSNYWDMPNKDQVIITMYQSKVRVRPKPKEITELDIADAFMKLQPIELDMTVTEILEEYLYIPLADMHFGHNTLNDYIDLQADLTDLIRNGYEEIVLSINGDYLHVDNFLNTTEKGTRVDDIDQAQAVDDAYNFIMPLIKLALECSPNVKLIYLPGNHAPSQDYMLIQGIKRLFPQLEVDDSVEEVKHTWIGGHSLFLHHGDKIKKLSRLHEVAVSKYGKEWGESKSRYVITGHLHHERSLSSGGWTHYQLQSPSKPSTFDKQYGFNTSEEGNMVFEFDKYKRRAIYYL